MKTSLIFALFGTALSFSVNAAKISPELLAGVEAGIDSDTAMSIYDLDKTQVILSSKPTGYEDSWYNLDTTTHYDIKVGQHSELNQRPCVAYELSVKHGSKSEEKNLNACKNYDGKWIAQLAK